MAVRILLAILLVAHASWGQSDRYIVYLKDKVGSPYSIAAPSQFLSARAIDRRSRQKIDITEEDLPVNTTYVEGIQSLGVSTFFTSRWMNCVLVEATASEIAAVQNLDFVVKAEMVAPGKKLSGGRIKKFKKKKDYILAPATKTQLEMLGLDAMQRDGFKGEGMLIAFLDSGYEGVNTGMPFQHLYQEGKILNTKNFVFNSSDVYQDDNHGTEVFSIAAAFSKGSYTGGAYGADFALFVTEDVSSEYRVEEFNWLFAAERADSIGADIIQASLGYNLFDDVTMDYKSDDLDGNTALVTRAANKAISKGMLVVCSAGNEGNNSWKYVTPPGDAKEILAIGSVGVAGEKSSFSSVGPTADGRFKPDVMALGSGTSVIKSSGALGTTSGTSVAAPLVTSLAAGLWQAYPYLTAKELYSSIIQSASQFQSPDNQKGYGIPNYVAVKNYLELSNADADIVLFPNPSADSIKIAFREPPVEPATISVYDTHGRLLQENTLAITWQNQPVQYDLSELAAGIYFAKIKAGTILKTIRLVKL